jgi:uncharacterized GH25 family protein
MQKRVGLMVGAMATTLMVAPLFAHDFWLQPAQFVLAARAVSPITIYVGHGAARERWGVGADRVVLFRTIGPDGVLDRRSRLTLNAPQVDAVVPLARRGSYLLAFQSREATSDLPSLRFDEYVAEEGLTPIADHRRRTGAQRRNGREFYSRRAKALVQVGPLDAADVARVTRPVGLTLEIVPERHPLSLKAGEKLAVRIVFNGQPLPGALVKLTNLGADAKPVAMVRSDRAGRAVFAVPRKGAWQFNAVWSEILTGQSAADYRTTFSSLTFGY